MAVVLLVVGTIVMFAFVAVTTLEPHNGLSKPVITFSAINPLADGFQFDVAGVSRSLPAGSYRVTLQVGATAGTAVTLAASMSFTVSGNTYTTTWTDVGGENHVTEGDQFRVTRAGGLPAQTDFTFRLLWSDGSQIQSATYTSP